jgi:hypothetical protein
MQEFFNSNETPIQGKLSVGEWSFIKQGLNRNLNTVKDYYYAKPFAVKSNHILVRLLNNIGVPYTYSLDRFSDIIDAKAFNLSMLFKMSSPIFRGTVFKDIFYGGDIDEILIAVDDPFDPEYIHKNWKKVSAVKVIYHPKSDLNLLLPNGKYFGNESGTAVISVNIAMLAVQYRAFLLEELKVLERNESPKTTSQFIHMFVLPNMLNSHLDIALFNRAYNLCMKQSMGLSYRKHVFHLMDYGPKIDDVYRFILDRMFSTDKTYKTILSNFPAISSESFFEALTLPDNAPTKQSIWSMVISRLKPVEFLVRTSPSNGNKLDRTTNNRWLRQFKLYENDRALDNILPSKAQIQNKIAIATIIENIK